MTKPVVVGLLPRGPGHVVVGLLGITHPHASARVRALREIEGVQVISAADDDPRLEYFTDKYGLDPVAVDALLADQRITAVLVHSKSVDMVPLALRALEAGKSVLVEKPGGGALADLTRLAAAARGPEAIVQVGYNVRFAESVTRARLLLDQEISGDAPRAVRRPRFQPHPHEPRPQRLPGEPLLQPRRCYVWRMSQAII